ncbi:MAG: hypothetical protein ACHQT8_06955 [Chlamydiales bacterium]
MFDLFLFLPFLVQAVAIGFDETYFHIKRGLPRWERIGHPLDTLSVLLSLLFVLFVPFSPFTAKIYAGIALFSCLMVTKDEFIHKHYCPPLEHWVHALLFLNHPIMLGAAGLMWAAGAGSPAWLLSYVTHPSLFFPFLAIQAVVAALFCLYQVVYWNFIWTE